MGASLTRELDSLGALSFGGKIRFFSDYQKCEVNCPDCRKIWLQHGIALNGVDLREVHGIPRLGRLPEIEILSTQIGKSSEESRIRCWMILALS
jgi:hypothetical protein